MADQTPAPADSYPDAGGGQAPIANGDSAKKRKRLDHNPGGELGSKEIIFARQLAEVYLLIDNVTNFPNKHMPPAPANDPQYAAVFGKHGDWLSQICSIPWPPHVEAEDDESDDDASKMAARLFLARDILNNAAEPANGMTIAFTQAVLEMRRSTRTAPEELYPESKELNSTSLGQALASDRMAFIAYPSLAHEAQKFNNSVSLLNRFVIFFAIFTFVVSWQVGSGSALLANVASARDNYAGANQAIDTAMQYGSIASTGGPAPTPPARPVRGRGPIKAIAAVPAPTTTISTGPTDPAIFCGNPSPIGNAARGQEIARRKVCADLNDRSASLIVAERDLEQWNERQDHGWSAGGTAALASLLNWREDPAAMQPCAKASCFNDAAVDTQWASVWIHVIGGIVLPIFYGVLGAGAAAMRMLSAKIKDSTLTPRDGRLVWINMALGSLAGGCIGLFVNTDTAVPSAISHLSTSALCFLAGFSVERVFGMLERIADTAFNAEKSPRSPGKR